MKNSIALKRYSIIILLALITACDDTINQEELDSVVIPSSNVSFNKYIQPIFDARCNNAGCHNGTDRASGLSLSNHASATADFLIVAPGLPDNSKLAWAIEGRTTSLMPPLGYRPLTKNQREGIITWIREGAKNN
ncbi:MAG: c-type cytochrome domain-containing protein [Melioribacteraceae bacterium]|nr:c-type cytochrome domain-containing protein [Melioribacteraceae bacterium]